MAFFTRRYDFKALKDAYAQAEKDYNPKKHKVDSKEPALEVFNSKAYFKLLSMNNKTFQRKNEEYYKYLRETNGDYSRRRGGNIAENMKAHNDWAKTKISENPELKNSFLQVFVDTYSMLCDLNWREAFKISFDYCRKTGDEKSICSAMENLYYTLAASCEIMLLKCISVEYFVAYSENPVHAVEMMQLEERTFMSYVVVPLIKITTLMKNTQNPALHIRNIMNGEIKANKGRSQESVNPFVSTEAFESIRTVYESMKGSFSAIAMSGLSALMSVTGVKLTTAIAAANAGFVPIGFPALAVIGALWFLFTLIPTIKSVSYYIGVTKINLAKELDFNSELLANNIATLKEEYDRMPSGKEKDEKKKIIDKQKELYSKMRDRLKHVIDANPDLIEANIGQDDKLSDEEAVSLGASYDTDGNDISLNSSGTSSSSSDDDFSLLL